MFWEIHFYSMIYLFNLLILKKNSIILLAKGFINPELGIQKLFSFLFVCPTQFEF